MGQKRVRGALVLRCCAFPFLTRFSGRTAACSSCDGFKVLLNLIGRCVRRSINLCRSDGLTGSDLKRQDNGK